jgi:hypothetical protein
MELRPMRFTAKSAKRAKKIEDKRVLLSVAISSIERAHGIEYGEASS